MSNKLFLTLGALVLTIGAGSVAYAAPAAKHENDAVAGLAKAKVSTVDQSSHRQRRAAHPRQGHPRPAGK